MSLVKYSHYKCISANENLDVQFTCVFTAVRKVLKCGVTGYTVMCKERGRLDKSNSEIINILNPPLFPLKTKKPEL